MQHPKAAFAPDGHVGGVTAGTIETQGFDPITFSIMLNRFNGIAEEMTATLEQSAWTSILALCRDFSCAVYDWHPRQVAMVDALPVHTTSLHLVLAEIARTFAGDIADGDVFMCNDPYRFNTHIGDLVTAAPVFVEGRLVFWSVTKGHQMDIGAFVPSSVTAAAQNVFQEGLTIPPVKLFDRGRERRDVTELYLANVRYRDLLAGDLMAQLGSIEKGRQRLMQLCAEFGLEQALACCDAMIAYAATRMQDEISRMPNGVYHGEGWIDSDGTDTLDIPIRVRVEIGDSRISVDYAGSGKQARGGVNGSYATSQAAGAAPFLYYIDPDIPHNQGVIDAISVTAPKGSICNPHYPASTSCATIVPSDMMSDSINKALAEAMPRYVLGGTARTANVPQFSGYAGWDGKPWGVMLFNNMGALGAAYDVDGWPLGESTAALGGMKIQSIEQIELLYPLHIESCEIEPDSMGLGCHIGGCGIRMSLRPLNGVADCITFGDGCRNPPHGVCGGTHAIGGGQYIESLETGDRRFVSAGGNMKVAPAERYVGVSTGGGGHGNPLERDMETVRQNIRDGIVTRGAAAAVFGVIVDSALDPVILVDETETRRKSLAALQRPVVEPVVPGVGRWAEDQLRPNDVFLLNPV